MERLDRVTSRDRVISQQAEVHGGVVTRETLKRSGLTDDDVNYRLSVGRLHALYASVYAVGHPTLGIDGRRWAALFSAGAGAVLSHRTAAVLWDMLSPRGPIHVTVPTNAGRAPRDGVRIHRSTTLAHDNVAIRFGFPVTSMARTLFDLAATEQRRVLEQAIDGAEVSGVFDLLAINRLLRQAQRRPGARRLREVLETHLAGSTITRSDLEERMLALCRAASLPQPLLNVHVEGWEVDCLWRRERLVVEVQGTRYHRTATRLARDAEKGADLLAAGYRVVYVTDRQIATSSQSVAKRVARLLPASAQGATHPPAGASPPLVARMPR